LTREWYLKFLKILESVHNLVHANINLDFEKVSKAVKIAVLLHFKTCSGRNGFHKILFYVLKG
jgi:hypothetical protein